MAIEAFYSQRPHFIRPPLTVALAGWGRRTNVVTGSSRRRRPHSSPSSPMPLFSESSQSYYFYLKAYMKLERGARQESRGERKTVILLKVQSMLHAHVCRARCRQTGACVCVWSGGSIDTLPHFNQRKARKVAFQMQMFLCSSTIYRQWIKQQTPHTKLRHKEEIKKKITRRLVMPRRLKKRLYLQLGHLWHSNEV